jgi:hypothetical protein
MICPLKKLGLITAQQHVKPEYCQCDEKDCAWWLEAQGCCSLPAIANLLELASMVISGIRNGGYRMSDRLLNYNEILEALNLIHKDDTYQASLVGHCHLSNKAQDAKTIAARDKWWIEKLSSEQIEDRLVRELCRRNGWELGNADYDLAVTDVKWFINQLKKEIENE